MYGTNEERGIPFTISTAQKVALAEMFATEDREYEPHEYSEMLDELIFDMYIRYKRHLFTPTDKF